MKIILSCVFALIVLVVFAFAPTFKTKAIKNIHFEKGDGIQFIESDWNKALAEAKKQNKLIFLDAYASWCGPCKLLKKNTFPDKEVGKYFNVNFINVAVDMEKGDGPALLQKYGVNAFPTLIITDADGKIITYTKGYIEPKELIKFGEFGLLQVKK
jgi:thioredoxin-related protein